MSAASLSPLNEALLIIKYITKFSFFKCENWLTLTLCTNNSVSYRDTWNYLCFYMALSIQYGLYSEYMVMGMGKNSLCFNMTHYHRRVRDRL